MIYLDSCLVIYAAEDRGDRGETARRAIRSADGPAISPLVMLECLVGPLRSGDFALRGRYEHMFGELSVVDLEQSAFVRAAELRALHGVRTPDALHLAAAQLSGCREFWTNDERLARASNGFARNVLR
ncbi:type II toxin-antitoxin system VapC family toxin [Miniimonas sp. S16]|uniref:type II toxin-antitoxin system VapC family toxin n=1 Tax=Miniimonas sp. S16 TaxID=2171623 RepID=UPI00131F1B8A|nr:type II toxin-antitoxin system VapC family toxin [Miniimonas sp. S16]